MPVINLRDIYPFYNIDLMVEVSDEVAEALVSAERAEQSYKRKARKYRALYSLDCENGIEGYVTFSSMTPEVLYERNLTLRELYAAMRALTPTQSRRIYALYVLGHSLTEIAKMEGVDRVSVKESIQRGLRQMEKYLKKFF